MFDTTYQTQASEIGLSRASALEFKQWDILETRRQPDPHPFVRRMADAEVVAGRFKHEYSQVEHLRCSSCANPNWLDWFGIHRYGEYFL